MSKQAIFPATTGFISSAGSQSGTMLSIKQAGEVEGLRPEGLRPGDLRPEGLRPKGLRPKGLRPNRSGPDHAPASLFPAPALSVESPTSATSGPSSSGSSASAALQSLLASKLRARLPLPGTTLYAMTWKERVTPSGRQICALRASAPRISGNGCTGWPTTNATDGKGASMRTSGKERPACDDDLPGSSTRTSVIRQCQLAGWTTPANHEAGGTPEQFLARKEKAVANGAQLGVSLTSLSMQVQTTGWQTPRVFDPKGLRPDGAGRERSDSPQPERRERDSVATGAGQGFGRLANSDGGQSSDGELQRGRRFVQLAQNPLVGFWRDADWLLCTDGKARPVESRPEQMDAGTAALLGYVRVGDRSVLSPLIKGTKNRIGRLRGYGNCLNFVVAKEFIQAAMECIP